MATACGSARAGRCGGAIAAIQPGATGRAPGPRASAFGARVSASAARRRSDGNDSGATETTRMPTRWIAAERFGRPPDHLGRRAVGVMDDDLGRAPARLGHEGGERGVEELRRLARGDQQRRARRAGHGAELGDPAAPDRARAHRRGDRDGEGGCRHRVGQAARTPRGCSRRRGPQPPRSRCRRGRSGTPAATVAEPPLRPVGRRQARRRRCRAARARRASRRGCRPSRTPWSRRTAARRPRGSSTAIR